MCLHPPGMNVAMKGPEETEIVVITMTAHGLAAEPLRKVGLAEILSELRGLTPKVQQDVPNMCRLLC